MNCFLLTRMARLELCKAHANFKCPTLRMYIVSIHNNNVSIHIAHISVHARFQGFIQKVALLLRPTQGQYKKQINARTKAKFVGVHACARTCKRVYTPHILQDARKQGHQQRKCQVAAHHVCPHVLPRPVHQWTTEKVTRIPLI